MLGLFSKKVESSGQGRKAIDLKFDLPPYRQQESKLPEPSRLWQHLDAISDEPVHLLVELNHFLHELNLTYLSSAKRYSLSDRCLKYASPALRSVFMENQKGKAIPENSAKREALIAAVKCCKELAISCKRIIKSDCGFTDKPSKSAKQRLSHSIYYALEMIHIEQRLKALRYQKLGEKNWRDCNRLFFSLLRVDEANRQFKPSAFFYNSRSVNETSNIFPAKVSAKDIYVATQLFGLMDPNAMSLQQLVVLESYLKQFQQEFQISLLDDDELPLNCVIAYSDQDRPPLLAGKSDLDSYACSINIKRLEEQLKKDHVRFTEQLNGGPGDEQKQKRNAKLVNNPADIERLLAIGNMLKRLQEKNRTDTRKYTQKEQDIYVYNGFTSGFRMLNGHKPGNEDEQLLQNQLNIDLSQRSATLSDYGEEDNFSQWEIVNESSSGLLIRTRETQYIKNLFVGQLMIFAKSKSELNNPAMGWVVRICRLKDANIEISIKLLSCQMQSVAVQTEFLKKNAMGMPGIMVFDSGEALQLLLHQSHRISSGSEVFIRRNSNNYTYTLGEMKFFQREFVLYELQ